MRTRPLLVVPLMSLLLRDLPAVGVVVMVVAKAWLSMVEVVAVA
jgi:hypothetical protein